MTPAGRRTPEDDEAASAQNYLSTLGLVRTAKSGDERALNALLQRYYPLVLRIAELRLQRRFRGHSDVEDVAQETLLDAFQSFASFEQRTEGGFRRWLSSIVENNIRDFIRRGEAQKRGGDRVRRMADLGSTVVSRAVMAADGKTPSQIVSDTELEECVMDAMTHDLAEVDREIIIHRKLYDMPFKEIAQVMDYGSVASARVRYSRAMDRLRRAVEARERETERP